MINPENVVVKVGNELDCVPDEVKATLEGIAALSGGLITLGHRGIITPRKLMKPFDGLINHMNESFGDPATVDQFNERFGDTLDEHFDAVVTGLGSAGFKGYIWSLGALDTLYRLAPEDRKIENDLTFTVIGFD